MGFFSMKQYCEVEDLIWDNSVMQTTLVTEYGLVCSKSQVRTIVNTTYMMGKLRILLFPKDLAS